MRKTIINVDKVGWRVNEWGYDAGIGRAYELPDLGELSSIKIRGVRIITTLPADYIRRYAERGASTTTQEIIQPTCAMTVGSARMVCRIDQL